jgi:hypothetical protein
MVIGDKHFLARGESMPMPMETGIRASARIGAPMAGHTAKIAFMRPDGPTLEKLPK